MPRVFILLSIFYIVPMVHAGLVTAPETPKISADAQKLVVSARSQIGQTVQYNPAYVSLSYPNGDVPRQYGVCTDVVIRALRDSRGVDLQKNIHEDMKQNFSIYPKKWGLKRPDKNIDHRRVPNIQTYFKRRGYDLPITDDPKDYLAGDIVTVTVPPQLPHIMVVSDKKVMFTMRPKVIHNIGQGTQEEDRLFVFSVTGHYRLK